MWLPIVRERVFRRKCLSTAAAVQGLRVSFTYWSHPS
jgi:hypothetical protein